MINKTNRYIDFSAGRLDQFEGFIKDISEGLVVVEFGPGSGDTLKQIEKSYGSARLTGFDMHPNKFSDKFVIHESDLNLFDFNEYCEIISEANVILLLDVLEHLVEPIEFLVILNRFTRKSTRYVISCPNFGSIRMLFAWLSGKVPRNEFGYFDKTHLHWFSPYDFVVLFDGLNYSSSKISYIYSKNLFFKFIQKLWPARLCTQFMLLVSK